MTKEYDLVVIGAGNAGQGAAGVALKAGLSVAIVEDREVGGTCPLRGCVPKKVLVAAAETLDIIARAHLHHVTVGTATLDWPALIDRKNHLIENLSSSMHRSLASRGATILHGQGRFIDTHTVEVVDREQKTSVFSKEHRCCNRLTPSTPAFSWSRTCAHQRIRFESS